MATKVINDDFTVYRSLGHIYHRQCDRPDARTRALKCYRRAADCALPASPTQAAELRLLAAIVLSEMPADSATGTGIDGAIDECDKALSHNKHLHAARFWRAKLLSRCGNGTAAAEDLKVVVEADAAFFTQAYCAPDLCGGCPETKDFIEKIRQRAEHQVRPAFEMLVAAREHWLLPPDLDDHLDAATRRLVVADAADIHLAVTSAMELFGRVKRLSRSLQPIAEVEASTQALFTLAFSPDGRFLATTDAERFVKLWRSEGWTEFRQLDAHPMVKCLTFAPDGRFLVTGGLTVSLWDVSTGRKEHEWELEDDVTRRVAFVRSGSWLIWKGTERAELGGWDVKTREPLPYDAIAEYGVEFDGVSAHDGEQTVWAEAQKKRGLS